jgi:hypothetical protein
VLTKFALIGQLAVAATFAFNGAWAQDGQWEVRRSSGEVWVAAPGVQKVALTPAAVLKPGDYIRTGQNGRALLVRGTESILISPNSAVGLPKETTEGLSTTILQESGSILLDVEKRSEKHFEVETPYLVAVVKGTQFRVSVDDRESKVEVVSGQVEVSELKSGKYALVLPGQSAAVAINGASGLSLSGNGLLDQIKQGAPRAPRVTPLLFPADVVPRANGQAAQPLRIKNALGEVKLDFQKVTKGIARDVLAMRADVERAKETDNSRSAATEAAGKASGAVNGLANGVGNSVNAVGNALGVGGGIGSAVSSAGGALGVGGGGGLGGGLGGGGGLGVGGGLGNTVGQTVGLVNGLGTGLGNVLGKGCKGKSC